MVTLKEREKERLKKQKEKRPPQDAQKGKKSS